MDSVYDPAAWHDPRSEARDIEAAVIDAIARNTMLHGQRIKVCAAAEGAVSLTGTVATQAQRRQVELSCWTVHGVHSLHDHLVVGCGPRRPFATPFSLNGATS